MLGRRFESFQPDELRLLIHGLAAHRKLLTRNVGRQGLRGMRASVVQQIDALLNEAESVEELMRR